MTRDQANEIIMNAAENSAKAMQRGPEMVREARKETLALTDHEALTLAKGIRLGIIG